MKILSTRRFTLWTRELRRWLSAKFDSISIDLTPVENKLDDVKSDVADVKTAVENIDFSTLAKEQTLTNALQSVLTALNPKATTNDVTTAKDAILEALSHISPEDPYSQALASFFNITEATEYQALTPAEAIAIARDCQYNVMGTDWPIPTWLPTGVTEAQVESAAEGLGIPYHEPTQTA